MKLCSCFGGGGGEEAQMMAVIMGVLPDGREVPRVLTWAGLVHGSMLMWQCWRTPDLANQSAQKL